MVSRVVGPEVKNSNGRVALRNVGGSVGNASCPYPGPLQQDTCTRALVGTSSRGEGKAGGVQEAARPETLDRARVSPARPATEFSVTTTKWSRVRALICELEALRTRPRSGGHREVKPTMSGVGKGLPRDEFCKPYSVLCRLLTWRPWIFSGLVC